VSGSAEPPALVDGRLTIAEIEHYYRVFLAVASSGDPTHYCIPDFLAFLKHNIRLENRYRAPAGKPGKLKAAAA